ncbi:FUSC family protein [Oceanobacillus rekensis]|uniref:FUSC family protein n=1 Tax=Oceanobacillus rekensis TaxID=937927 RepID=UPI001FE4EEC9|nr:FUSC family protein [Oceanobacillus rekensis]
MAHWYKEHTWLRRLLASDPGQIRLYKAGKTTISVILSLFTTFFIIIATGNEALMPAVVSAAIGMMGILVVLDDTRKKKQLTTILLGVSAIFGVTIGSSLTGSIFLIDSIMILLVFGSFYLTRFGVRYFSLCMVGFMTVYISAILNLENNQLAFFYLGIAIGVAYAFIFNFILFQSTAKSLKRSIHSFHIQSNLTFDLLLEAMQERNISQEEHKHLHKQVAKVREYALIVSGYINPADVKELWPGLTPAQLRLYVFDSGMLIETLTNSFQSLKEADALEIDELRKIMVWVTKSLRDTEILAPNYEEQNLEEAEIAVQALRLLIADLFTQKQQPEGWLFLIRRIESITNHVIKGAITIQQSLQSETTKEEHAEEAEKDTAKEDKKGMRASTKKAYQALVAGTLAIIVGQFISPAQPYWILLSTFVVLLGTQSTGRIYAKGFQRSFGTIIGAILGFALAKLVSGYSTLEILAIFLVLFLAYYLITVSYTVMSVFITMMLAFLYDILMGGITLSLIGARVIDTIAGAVIALAVSSIIFPTKTKDKVAESINDYLKVLQPYLITYVKGFRGNVDIKELSENAFQLDEKLQTISDEASPLVQRGEYPALSDTNQWITVISAINYYARQLVASSYRKGFDYPEELEDVFIQMEEKLENNMKTLITLFEGKKDPSAIIYRLEEERKQIEQHSPSRHESKHDLIHHLYYVWRVNQSIVELALEIGVKEA